MVIRRYMYFQMEEEKEISNELMKKYPESLLSVNMIDIDFRNINYEIERDMGIEFELM